MRRIRAIAPKTHVPLNQARGQLVKRSVDINEQVNKASHVCPAGKLQAQVVALGDDDTLDLDRQRRGNRLVQVAPIIGSQHHAVRAAHPPQESHVSAYVKGVGRTLMVRQSVRRQQRVRHVEAIHGREPCNRDARLWEGTSQLGRNRRLARPRRAGQPQHAHGVTGAGAAHHGLDNVSGHRRGLRALPWSALLLRFHCACHGLVAHLRLPQGLMTGSVDQGKLIHLSVWDHT